MARSVKQKDDEKAEVGTVKKKSSAKANKSESKMTSTAKSKSSSKDTNAPKRRSSKKSESSKNTTPSKSKSASQKASVVKNKSAAVNQQKETHLDYSIDENRDAARLLDKLAEILLLADPGDLVAYGEAHALLGEISSLASSENAADVAECADKVSVILEGAMLGEQSLDKTVELINKCITWFQERLVAGLIPEETSKPCLSLSDADNVEPHNESDVNNREKNEGVQEPIKSSGSTISMTDDKIVSDFLERQASVIEDWENYTVAFENTGKESDLSSLRRIVHTMKGETALIGLEDVERVLHRLEDLMETRINEQVFDVLLGVADFLKVYYKAIQKGLTVPDIETVIARINKAFSSETEDTVLHSETVEEEVQTQVEKRQPVDIEHGLEDCVDDETPINIDDTEIMAEFCAEALEHLHNADISLLTLEADPSERASLDTVFRAFHTIKGVAGFLELNQIGALAHETENLLDSAREGKIFLQGTIIDLVFESTEIMKDMVTAIRDAVSTGSPAMPLKGVARFVKKLKNALGAALAGKPISGDSFDHSLLKEVESDRVGDILVGMHKVTEDHVKKALETQKKSFENSSAQAGGTLQKKPHIGEILIEEGVVKPKDVAGALREQGAVRKRDGRSGGVDVKESVKIDSERLDKLLDTIGELVIAESMVIQSPEIASLESTTVMSLLNRLDKITRSLQEMSTSMRMVPILPTFQRMARLVRDLSKKSGKAVDFVMSGEDTELDKAVVDRIADPLMHMVRNAVDHGLENNEDRAATGKPSKGKLELRAFHKAGSIFIEVVDDGKGLNPEKIFSKAVEKNVIAPDARLSEKEIFNLIFEPGFSTADKITDVSGRGVGMDVVKRTISDLRGSVDITSNPGQGSLFSIRLPLTLAIIDGMVAKTGNERYIIPTLSVYTSLRPTPESISTFAGKGEMLTFQGNVLPLFRLGELFSIDQFIESAENALVIVVEDEGRQVGLLVDELLGQQQIVIKPLGDVMKDIPGVAGGAIMPDGQVGLILDVGGLVSLAHQSARNTEELQ